MGGTLSRCLTENQLTNHIDYTMDIKPHRILTIIAISLIPYIQGHAQQEKIDTLHAASISATKKLSGPENASSGPPSSLASQARSVPET